MQTESKNRVLWILPKWTFPINDGARVANDSLIRSTVAAGANIDVLCLPQAFETIDLNEMRDHWKVNKIFVLPRPLPNKKWAKFRHYLAKFLTRPLFPITYSSFAEQMLRKETERIISEFDYQHVVLDGLHLGALFLDKSRWVKPKAKVILRAHNVESDLWKLAAREKKNIAQKWILRWQQYCVSRVERTIAENVDAIAAISEEDGRAFKVLAPETPLKVIPLGLNFSKPLKVSVEQQIHFLFIGRLDWAPNRDGLKWILSEVWPKVHARRPDARLQIVGSGDSSWLSSYAHIPNVDVIGYLKSSRQAYEKCHFSIAPLKYGSGTKIKAVEAIAMNRGFISTRMGVKGVGLTDDQYVPAESTDDWINTLSTIEWNIVELERLNHARKRVSMDLDEDQVGKSFYAWLSTLK